jgi:hypothetical protein
MTKLIQKYDIFFLSFVFFIFLFSFQYKFFFYELGVLTTYINNFHALNEITFWSSFYNDAMSTLSSNPLQYNFNALTIWFLSHFLGKTFVFSFLPVLFTASSFYFILKIFNLYKLQASWAVLLAFLGMTSISSMPLMNILVSLLTFNHVQLTSLNGYFDLLSSFSSSYILLIFVIFFYFSAKAYIHNLSYMKYIPFYASLLVFMHPALFIFGYSFGLMLNAISTYRKFTVMKEVNLQKFLFINLAPLILVLPYIIFNLNFFGSFNQTDQIFAFNEFLLYLKAAFFYFILPFGLMVLAGEIFKVDPFELIVKFLPILLIGLIEFLIRTMFFLNILPINDLTIIDRVSIYFLHFLYFLPFLFIVTRNFNYLPDINSSSKRLLRRIQKSIIFLFKDLGVFITTVTLIYLSFVSFNFIDHKPYKILNNRAQLLLNEIPEILSDKLLVHKNIEFLSIDERIIASFLFKNKISLNPFLQYGSSNHEMKFNFLEHIYQKNGAKISDGFLDRILDENFDQYSFENHARNLNLLLWLKYNNAYNLQHSPSLNNKNIEEELDIFFNENYLIHHKSFFYDYDFEKLNSRKIGSYFIIYS